MVIAKLYLAETNLYKLVSFCPPSKSTHGQEEIPLKCPNQSQQRKHLIQHIIILLHSLSTDCSCSKHLVSLEGGVHTCSLFLPLYSKGVFLAFSLSFLMYGTGISKREKGPHKVWQTHSSTHADSAD